MVAATAEKKTIPTKSVGVKKTSKTEKIGGDFAVIETGGKQYGVVNGDTIKIEKLIGEHEVGDAVSFEKVLLVDGADLNLGTPYITDGKVSGTITEIGRNKKVTVIKYKQKSRYFKKNGYRQPFFKVLINSIA